VSLQYEDLIAGVANGFVHPAEIPQCLAALGLCPAEVARQQAGFFFAAQAELETIIGHHRAAARRSALLAVGVSPGLLGAWTWDVNVALWAAAAFVPGLGLFGLCFNGLLAWRAARRRKRFAPMRPPNILQWRGEFDATHYGLLATLATRLGTTPEAEPPQLTSNAKRLDFSHWPLRNDLELAVMAVARADIPRSPPLTLAIQLAIGSSTTTPAAMRSALPATTSRLANCRATKCDLRPYKPQQTYTTQCELGERSTSPQSSDSRGKEEGALAGGAVGKAVPPVTRT